MHGCDSSFLAGFLEIFRSLISIIQILGPLLLIISLAFTFIKLMQNPYDKKLVSRKKLLFSISNCVFVPILLTMTLNMIDESSNFGACWKHASTTNFKESKYMEDDNNNSNENSNVNVDSNITNGSGIIFIGDSRTVQMYSYLTNTWSNNTYSKAGVIKYGNDLFIA